MPQTLAPVIYLPHGGGPLPLLGDPAHAGLNRFLREIPAQLGRPRAILIISAHWETPRPCITSGTQPELIYDYYGFAPESYRITYAAPGAPTLAARVQQLLRDAGMDADLDPSRGFDHGLFVPLKLMYPQAELPCVQVSLAASLDPATHIALGKALAPLRKEQILIVGSGLSFHNLRAFFAAADSENHARSAAFDRWLTDTCSDPGIDSAGRERRLLDWAEAPHARYCHPREEHLLPLHVCFGAACADTPQARVVFNERLMDMQVSGLLWGQA